MTVSTTSNVAGPILVVNYAETSQASNSVLDFGFLGQNETVIRVVRIKNIGLDPLIINIGGISLTNNGNSSALSSNPSQTSTLTLTSQQETTISIVIDTATLGSTSSVLQILTNDESNLTYLLELKYEIKLPFEFVVKIDDDEKTDQETIDFGDRTQLDDFIKTIRITNAGVTKNIRITDISVEGSVVGSVKALPFIVQTFERNVYEFEIIGNTVSKGKKTGKLNIQWEIIN